MKSPDKIDFNWNQILRQCVEMLDGPFVEEMKRRSQEAGIKSLMGVRDCVFLYSLTRWKKPRVVVESGGFMGMSTSFILKALADEGVEDPQVYSVELLEDVDHGGLIPDELRSGFIPLRGRIEDFMKEKKFPDHVEMFLHDSSHRYRHMLMEYRYFWQRMQDADLLVSHDVNLSRAFTDFVSGTYRHNKLGQTDPETVQHHTWGRQGNMGFVIKRERSS